MPSGESLSSWYFLCTREWVHSRSPKRQSYDHSSRAGHAGSSCSTFSAHSRFSHRPFRDSSASHDRAGISTYGELFASFHSGGSLRSCSGCVFVGDGPRPLTAPGPSPTSHLACAQVSYLDSVPPTSTRSYLGVGRCFARRHST